MLILIVLDFSSVLSCPSWCSVLALIALICLNCVASLLITVLLVYFNIFLLLACARLSFLKMSQVPYSGLNYCLLCKPDSQFQISQLFCFKLVIKSLKYLNCPLRQDFSQCENIHRALNWCVIVKLNSTKRSRCFVMLNIKR